jgi:hypothetical protein
MTPSIESYLDSPQMDYEASATEMYAVMRHPVTRCVVARRAQRAVSPSSPAEPAEPERRHDGPVVADLRIVRSLFNKCIGSYVSRLHQLASVALAEDRQGVAGRRWSSSAKESWKAAHQHRGGGPGWSGSGQRLGQLQDAGCVRGRVHTRGTPASSARRDEPPTVPFVTGQGPFTQSTNACGGTA